MDTACNDLIQTKILNEINKRKKVLRNTYDNLKKTSIENHFFESVLADYEQYYKYIKTDKEKQLLALQTISNYLNKLISNTDVLNKETTILKKDQENILYKLASVRKELEEITQ
jgi:hypothetical protein